MEKRRRIAGKGAARVCSNHRSLLSTQHHGCAPRLPWSTNGTLLILSLSSFFFFPNLNNSPFLLFDYSFKSQLEEIRQKRAAERLIKASSGPDLTQPSFHNGSHHLSLSLIIKLSFFLKKKYLYFLCTDFVGMKKSESGNRLTEVGKIICKSFQFEEISSALVFDWLHLFFLIGVPGRC